jgi:hypothetical protein
LEKYIKMEKDIESLAQQIIELKEINDNLRKRLEVYEPFSRSRSSYFDSSKQNKYKIRQSIENILEAICSNTLQHKSMINILSF